LQIWLSFPMVTNGQCIASITWFLVIRKTVALYSMHKETLKNVLEGITILVNSREDEEDGTED